MACDRNHKESSSSIIMSSLIVAFVILVFGSLCTSQIITPCPKECTCEKQFFPESQGVGARVNCSSRRLKKFPWPLPFATTTLLLQDNKIAKLDGWQFNRMYYLKELHLEGNRIKKIRDHSLGYLATLEALYLHENRIEEMAFGAFKNCSRLITLNLARNKLTKLKYGAFEGLGQLENLDLSANMISSIEDGAFLSLYRLKTLSLGINEISKIGAHLFADVYSLTSLYLFKNRISVIEPGAFSRLMDLRVLSLFDNKIPSIPQRMVKGLENLEELYLQRNRISKIEPWTFSATKKLQKLYLYSNLLTFVPENMFEELRTLRVLHLGINLITYIADNAFRDLHNLNVLYLDSNRLTILNARTFYGLIRLKDLHLFFNNIHFLAKGTFDHLKSLSRLVWDVPEAYRQSMPPTAKKTKGSRLNCDCNARWLRDWLIERELGDITCAFPSSLSGVSVAQLDVRHFVCEKLKASLYPKKTAVLLGENVQLRCETSTGATYHWILNGTRLESDQYRVMNPLGTLTIYGLAEEDLGEYVCVAQSEAGLSASHAMVDAGVRPSFTTYPEPVDAREPQKPVVFQCKANGSPTPLIRWYKDGLLIVGTPEESRFHITMEGSLMFMGRRYHITREGSLVIFEPRVEDEGTYKCEAENALGKVSYEVGLYVEMGAKCDNGCKRGSVCSAVKYGCLCSRGFYKKDGQCIQVTNKKTTSTKEETGSGSGSSSESDQGSGSGVGSGKSADTSGDERNPTDQSGAGVDQEESGDKSSSNKGLENSDGESGDGTLESLESGKKQSRQRREAAADLVSPLETPPMKDHD